MINLANMEEVQAIINDKSLDFVGKIGRAHV